MRKLNRRDFLMSVSAATLATAHIGFSATSKQRVFVASGTPEGIRSFDWNAATGELTDAGIAAKIETVDWICFSPDRKYLFFVRAPLGVVVDFDALDVTPTETAAETQPDTEHLSQQGKSD